MSLQDLLAAVLAVSLTAYAILAGADFGAGILDLLAGKRESERGTIAAGIGPVWEANHVWLIFSITILFSAFPTAFSALGTALLAPFTVALLAIVLRGAALGVRSSQEPQTPGHTRLSRLFGAASLTAPLAFGLVAGGLAQASRTTPATLGSVASIPWTGPFAITVGVLAVALCVQLAAGFMTLRLARGDQAQLAERFRRRGLQAGGGVLVLGAIGLAVASWTAPALYHRLTTVALPLVIVALAAMLASLVALAGRRYAVARAATLTTGAALMWGWFVAQSPNLIGTRLTLNTAAATHPALTAIAIAGGVVLLAVLPAFYLLFVIFARAVPEVSQ
jgi:cytochrome d ubiquinol oxidase subunit II